MNTLIFKFFLLILLLRNVTGLAQPDSTGKADDLVKAEQISFLQFLGHAPIDSNIISRLAYFLGPEADSIRNSLLTDSSIPEKEKVKAFRSILFFMYEMRVKLDQQKFDVYDIPDALDTYRKLLYVLTHGKPFEDLLLHLDSRLSQLMAIAFWEYEECAVFDDVAMFKRVVSYPMHIIPFLEDRPGFRFTDSLLLIGAANDPMEIVDQLKEEDSELQRSIKGQTNIYFQQIVSLANYHTAPVLMPFIVPLAEKRITVDEIIQIRENSTKYFQLLVNTLVNEIHRRNDNFFLFLIPLRNAIKERSVVSFVNSINDLHASPDEIRFEAVNDLRAEDLFYIITSCEEELYTSSYLGLYRRLMDRLPYSSLDSLFRMVHYDQFHQFMRMAANYNTMADFLCDMPPHISSDILKRFISGLQDDPGSALNKAMDIADSFNGLEAVPGINEIFRNELLSNRDKCRSGALYLENRLYNILLEIFDLLNVKDKLNELWLNLGDPEVLPHKALQDKNGKTNELVLFYGDEDGVASFNNFMTIFRDQKKWKVERTDFWVAISSLSGDPLVIYANLPLDDVIELDLAAQDSLCAYLDQQFLKPSVIFHRGHSYHLAMTMKRIQPWVKLAILGSCGGYNSILSVADLSPDAQVIVSKKMGSKYINDPLFEVINEFLREGKDLVWAMIWKKLQARFRSDEFLLNLFDEYVPPSRNLSLFVFKLFNFSR